MFPIRSACLSFCVALAAALASSSSLQAKVQWTAVPEADLEAKDSASAPGAKSEILFEKHVLDGDTMDNYIRGKIYTQKGLDEASVFKIPSSKENKIQDIAARVVKRGGRTIELKKTDFKETVASKFSFQQARIELKYTSFAFPELEVGDVIEFRWRQSMTEWFGRQFALECQQEVPVREFEFRIEASKNDYNIMWFNCPTADFKKVGRERATLSIKNIPPFESEPLMPPEKDFRGWIVILFSHPYMRWFSDKEMWQEIGNYLGEDFRLSTKPSGAIRDLAKKLGEGATTPEEKLAAYYNFCQREISNFSWIKSAELIEAKKARDDAQNEPTADQTLRSKSGYSNDIDRVFAALARAGGFEVRLGFNADRNEMQNSKGQKNWIFMNRYCVAVKIGNAWHMYSPGKYIVPATILSSRDEMMEVFVCDEDKSWKQVNQASPPEATLVTREGRFTLDEEGTLEGQIEITMTGHEAVEQKDNWWGETESDATKSFQKQFSDRLSGTEFTDFQWTNLAGRELPVVIKTKVRIPGYAEVAGSKLVVNPNVFTARAAPLFSTETRKYPILLPYAEHFHDDIQIVVPENFVLDGGSAPRNVADSSGILSATFKAAFKPKSHTLIYTRDEILGGGQNIEFRPESYLPIKNIFEQIKKSDDHVFVLKPKPASPNPTAATTPADSPLSTATQSGTYAAK